MANQKQSDVAFLIYKDWVGMFKLLSAEQLQELVFAIFDYQNKNKDFTSDDDKLKMAWEVIKSTFIRDNKKYEKRCEQNREKILKRWKNKNENEENKGDKPAYDLDEYELKMLKNTPKV